MAGIYIHIPFCRQACHYCDFHFSTSRKNQSALLTALQLEIKMQADFLQDSTLSTIYFGGGTPSLLPAQHILQLLDCIKDTFQTSPNLEITLEANPDDLTETHLQQLYSAGINRLSIGIQSFQDPILKWMNRAHNAEQALNCLPLARKSGFQNISMDLIYAIPLPGHSLIRDLETTIKLQPDHISAYNLTIEPGTAFGHQLKNGNFKEVSEEQAASDFLQVLQHLEEHGFQQYEISNFSLPGKESLHNRSYWAHQPYLGIGPSAHSFNGRSRQYNVANNRRYLEAINQGLIPSSTELLTDAQKVNELVMLGLRTREGVDLTKLINEFDCNLVDHHQQYIQDLTEGNYAHIEENKLILTNKGKLIADRIASDLFIEE